jgi:glycosyltransferase involved in cell wall biosynthesis
MNKPNLPKPGTTAVRPRSATVKVLHLINGEHFSGAERVQDLLGLCLPQSGFEVSFACLKAGRFPAERQAQHCPLFEVPMRGKFDRRAIGQLGEIVSSGNYEILHAHTPRTLLVASQVAARVSRPLVYHVHSPVGRDSTRLLGNRINQWVEKWSSRRVSQFICVSDSLRQYMKGLGFPASHLTTVPNGVAIVPHLSARSSPGPTWTIGTTALFRPRKGVEVLLQGLADLKSGGSNVRLLAVGPFETREYEHKIRCLADELHVSDLIEWTGFTRNVQQYLQRMDLFVLPSLFGEGLPMVILEAMANGVPVVAANVEGIPQAIRDGVDGLIFDAGDAADLANSVRRFQDADVDWQAMRQSALDRQHENFSDASMAAGVAAVYERALEPKIINQNR